MSKKVVYVGLSGGVDSAVSAVLLKQQGYRVYGIHLKMFTLSNNRGGNACTAQEDMAAAQEVAKYLEIPFEVWDFNKDYKRQVIDYLFREYALGRTPNPDVMCNRYIKFGLFYDLAIEKGADFVATGHYARISCHLANNESKLITNINHGLKKKNQRRDISYSHSLAIGEVGGYYLLRGIDPQKDQSYFLWAVSRIKLAKILFPVGDKLKIEVRALAKAFGLPNANRKDSQGVCFIGKLDLPEFLKLRIPAKQGDVVTTAGKVVGRHPGAWYYTVGQRHGFGSAQGLPQYVAQKDVRANRLVVAGSDSETLYSQEVLIGNINWLSDVRGQLTGVSCQARYRQEPILVQRITKDNKGRLRVYFAKPAWAVAPGQSMVFYKGAQMLGGGIIQAAA